MPVTFEDTDSVEMEAIMGVNTAGALRVTKVALPYMLNDSYFVLITYTNGKEEEAVDCECG
jgi:short-subunit dehydrogenase